MIDSGEAAGKIYKVMIPTEEVMSVKNNQKKISKRKFFPGYVLINIEVTQNVETKNLEMGNETYWKIRKIIGVSGFLGDDHPVPMQEKEMQGILDLMNASEGEKPKPAVQFEKGENVRITEGPFRYFMGRVEEVNEQRAKLWVTVTVFDRPTRVELDFLQVEKV